MPKPSSLKNPLLFQKRFINQLRDENLLNEVFNTIPDTLIFVKDKKLRFIWVNQTVMESFKRKNLKELIGLSDVDFLPKDLVAKYNADDIRVIKTGEPIINREERAKNSNGEEAWFSTTKMPLFNKKGKIIGLAGISRNISLQKEMLEKIESQKKKLERLNQIDPLTGAYNRRFFEKQAPKFLKVHQRENNTYSILLMDLDNFKEINDKYGHPAGDYVLKKFSETVQSVLKRTSDFFIRYGGDEFVGCLFGTDEKAAKHISERILTNLREYKWPKRILKEECSISASIGIATAHDPEDLKTVLKKADKALYDAKRKGKSGVSVH